MSFETLLLIVEKKIYSAIYFGNGYTCASMFASVVFKSNDV